MKANKRENTRKTYSTAKKYKERKIFVLNDQSVIILVTRAARKLTEASNNFYFVIHSLSLTHSHTLSLWIEIEILSQSESKFKFNSFRHSLNWNSNSIHFFRHTHTHTLSLAHTHARTGMHTNVAWNASLEKLFTFLLQFHWTAVLFLNQCSTKGFPTLIEHQLLLVQDTRSRSQWGAPWRHNGLQTRHLASRAQPPTGCSLYNVSLSIHTSEVCVSELCLSATLASVVWIPASHRHIVTSSHRQSRDVTCRLCAAGLVQRSAISPNSLCTQTPAGW